MRIAIFVEFFPPDFGSDRRIYEIMTRLSKKHEIHFIVLPPFRMLSGRVSLAKGHLHFQGRENIVKRADVTVHYIPISGKLIAMWGKSYPLAYLLTMISTFIGVFRSLTRIQPATIVLNYPSVYTGLLGLIIGRGFLQRPIVLDFNDLIAQYTSYLLGIKPESVTARLLVLIQDFIAKNINKIVAPTEYIKEYCSKLGIRDSKIAIVPNGVDTSFFDPRKYSQEKAKSHLQLSKREICVYCGRLDSWAGSKVILQLSKAFALRDSNAAFLIIGSGEEKAPFAKNVVSVGAVAYEEVPEMLASADVVLVPFPDNEVSRAASPLKLFEGMAMQKAIVASNVNGIREVISDRVDGIVVSPSSMAEWDRTVSELLNDRSMSNRLGENARNTVEQKYDWKKLAEKYEGIIAECATNGLQKINKGTNDSKTPVT